MHVPIRREEAIWLARFVFAFEVVALAIAGLLGIVHGAITRTDPVEAFFLWTFLLFLLILIYAVLSGPGMFLSRPKFAVIGPEGARRWRRWLSTPQIGTDREFFELVLYAGLGFLLLAIATGIGALARVLRG